MRLLLLYPRIPFPPDKGDKIRTYRQFTFLAERHEVWCGCFVDDPADWQHVGDCARLCAEFEALPLSRPLSLWGGLTGLVRGRSLTAGYLSDGRMNRLVDQWSQRGRFDAVLCFGSGMGGYGLRAEADRRCLDLCDLDSLKWGDYAELRRGPGRWLYSLESQRVEELEQSLASRFDATILITASEAQYLREQTGTTKIHVVPNGADPDGQAACGPPAAEPVIAFVGAMDYWPNQDAVRWFAQEVWGELKRRVPGAEWIIVGRNPGPQVRRLSRLEGVEVTGRVPEVVSYLRGARVVIAPLRVARGLQNKVLEGMAAGRPVVATTQAARGIALEAVPGLTVAGSRDDMLATLVRLLRDKGHAEEEGQAARAWVGENCKWADRLEDLERIVAGPRVLMGRSAPAEEVTATGRWPIEVGA